jgi:hypothetical protein
MYTADDAGRWSTGTSSVMATATLAATSDYNSIDAERDAQEDDDDEGQPHPKPKVPSSYEWFHFFRGYIDTSWVES